VLGRELTIYEQSLRTTALSLSYGFPDDPPGDRAKMDELAREYRDTHDPEIPEEIFELARRLREMEH
jgi:hypothetical protein